MSTMYSPSYHEASPGIIDFTFDTQSIPKDAIASFYVTRDGYLLIPDEYDEGAINRRMVAEPFVVCYKGLQKLKEKSGPDDAIENFTKVTIETELLPEDITTHLLTGKFLGLRAESDPLLPVLHAETNEYSVSYGSMVTYERNSEVISPIELPENSYLTRDFANCPEGDAILSFLKEEMGRESGHFIMGGQLEEDQLRTILSDPSFIIAYMKEADEVISVVALAETPNVLPWVNMSRVEEYASSLNVPISSVKLAFLAFTSEKYMGTRKASPMFAAAINGITRENEQKIAICAECSPRSIVYTPFLMRRLMTNWRMVDGITERTFATVLPKSDSAGL